MWKLNNAQQAGAEFEAELDVDFALSRHHHAAAESTAAASRYTYPLTFALEQVSVGLCAGYSSVLPSMSVSMRTFCRHVPVWLLRCARWYEFPRIRPAHASIVAAPRVSEEMRETLIRGLPYGPGFRS